MQYIEISAKLRTQLGKGPSRRLRTEGFIPATVYGKDYEPKSVQVLEQDIEKVYRTKLGVNSLLQLNIDGADQPKVIIKDVQGHAINRRLKHMDFQVVQEGQKITVHVPVRIEGRSAGVIQGGVREQFARWIELSCVVGHVPEEIVIDVSDLNIGDNIHIRDVELPEHSELREGYNPAIVGISNPKRGATADQTAAQAETAEGEEGAAPAEGEGAPAPAPAEGGDKPAE